MTAADYGYVTPQGSDLISQGDNAITSNANRSAYWFDRLRFARASSDERDLNNYREPGAFDLPAPYPTGYTNYPEGNYIASKLLVIGGSGASSWPMHILGQYGASPRLWWRIAATTTTWNEWQEIGSGGGGTAFDALPVSDSHSARVQALKDAYPLVSTHGKGAVVFRYDHGLTNFKDALWPLHQQYNIPAYIAMNSRNWDLGENSGATQADARSWIASGLVEFGNHTADHNNKDDDRDIYDNIVTGRRELETQLNTRIHGFTVPGLTGDKFKGFGSGTLNSYSETYAGGLILANHGITSGIIGPVQRVLDGEVRQGGRHYTWEASTWSDIKGMIDNAVNLGTALTIMAHPRTMGMTGYLDAALAEQVISYVRSLIDSGDLADLSYYQSHHATTALIPSRSPVTVERGVVKDPTFEEDATHWGASSSWARNGDYLWTASVNPLEQEVDFTEWEWARGSDSVVVVEVLANANYSTVSFSVSAGGETHEADIPHGATSAEVRLHVRIPPNAGISSVRVARLSGGYFRVKSIRWFTK